MTVRVTLTAESLTGSLGESLLKLSAEQFGQLLPFVPDTPWTTTVIHVIQRHQGRVYVDSLTEPRNLVVIASGDASTRTLDQVFLFGSANSDALKTFMGAVRSPMEVICDGQADQLVPACDPGAKKKESIVFWYERLEDADVVRVETGPRRLRISEAEQVGPLVPGWALRTARTTKELVTGGTCYVTEDTGRIVSAAYTVDQSMKYERIAVVTSESARKKGYGVRTAARVVRAIADQGRIPCAVVDRRDAAGLRLAEKLRFTRRALMTTWITSFRK